MGLCLGGALAAMLAAHMAATGEKRIKSMTLLNTLLDYSGRASWATSRTSKPSPSSNARWRRRA